MPIPQYQAKQKGDLGTIFSHLPLGQAVTNLAYELNAPIAVDEFRTLNRCLEIVAAGTYEALDVHAIGSSDRQSLRATRAPYMD